MFCGTTRRPLGMCGKGLRFRFRIETEARALLSSVKRRTKTQ